MQTEQYVTSKIKDQGLIPLFYHEDKTTCIAVTKTMYDAGIRIVEFTNRGENALQNFEALINARNNTMPGLLLGAGTIKTDDDALAFIEAGADFLVSPIFDSSVCDTAYMHKILWIPGCMTPTEIHVASQAGCKLIKLFPGQVLQPAYVSAIAALFPGMLFMPTGGVDPNETNLKAWFTSGVCAVGMGSKLITKEILNNLDTTTLFEKTTALLSIIKQVKE